MSGDTLLAHALIYTQVGDNVGDVAGMGADLFESFVGSLIAAITLADGDSALIMLPLWVAGSGIVASIFGYFAVGTRGSSNHHLLFALHKGTIVASAFVCVFSIVIVSQLFPGRAQDG